MSLPLIHTSRTILRPYVEGDAGRVAPIFSDPVTMKFWPQPFADQQIEAWVRRNIEFYERIGVGRMMIELRETGEIIGDCGIMQTEVNGEQEYDVGYIIHHPYWRQGYAVECASAAVEYGRRKGVGRIVANMAHDHIGSQRVAEKLGMKREGEFLNTRNRGIRTFLYVLGL